MISALGARAEIFTNTTQVIAQHPLWGSGQGSFNYVYPEFREYHLNWFPDIGTRLTPIAMFSGQAHNEVLQVWSELGLIGLFLSVLFIKTLRKPKTQLQWAAIFTLAVCFILSMVGFPLRNPSTSLLAVISISILMERRRETREHAGIRTHKAHYEDNYPLSRARPRAVPDW